MPISSSSGVRHCKLTQRATWIDSVSIWWSLWSFWRLWQCWGRGPVLWTVLHIRAGAASTASKFGLRTRTCWQNFDELKNDATLSVPALTARCVYTCNRITALGCSFVVSDKDNVQLTVTVRELTLYSAENSSWFAWAASNVNGKWDSRCRMKTYQLPPSQSAVSGLLHL